MLPLKVHNVLDYVIGALLVLSPYVFGFSGVLEARNVFLVLGYALIAYSLVTKYYYSIAKLIPLPVHMFLDVVVGLVLLLAPSLLGYRTDLSTGAYVWHFVLGLGALGMVTFTRNRAESITNPFASGMHHRGV